MQASAEQNSPPAKYRIDPDILSGKFNGPEPGEFSEDILNKEGKAVGSWNAFFCESKKELSEHLGPCEELLNRIAVLGIWPLAYLESINVDEEQENLGYGSKGLEAFAAEARRRGAMIGLVRIGFDDLFIDNSDESKNRHFYRKNGWSPLDAPDSFELPLSYLPICATPST